MPFSGGDLPAAPSPARRERAPQPSRGSGALELVSPLARRAYDDAAVHRVVQRAPCDLDSTILDPVARSDNSDCSARHPPPLNRPPHHATGSATAVSVPVRLEHSAAQVRGGKWRTPRPQLRPRRAEWSRRPGSASSTSRLYGWRCVTALVPIAGASFIHRAAVVVCGRGPRTPRASSPRYCQRALTHLRERRPTRAREHRSRACCSRQRLTTRRRSRSACGTAGAAPRHCRREADRACSPSSTTGG